MPVRKLNCPFSEDHGYDTLITYQYRASTLNSFGEVTNESTWRDSTSHYGNVKTGNGSEVWRAKQIHSEITAIVTLPWGSETKDMTSDGRFQINGRTYEILYAQNVEEKNEKMQFGCVA